MEVDMSQSDTTPMSLTMSQTEQGAALLARVFQHDPMMKYFIPDSTRMLDIPVRFYRANIHMGLLYGEVYTTRSMEGVAIWVSPGNTDFTFGQLLRSGLLTASLSMGLKTLGRFMRSASYFEKVKKQAISGPHWVLVFLGIEPSQQGKGLGGGLIQPILDRADAEGVPCYLDSTNERNLTFYKKHGFEVAARGQVPNGGPQIWAMLREPDQR
jgi:GNAT superfamily N-acetyltransferase